MAKESGQEGVHSEKVNQNETRKKEMLKELKSEVERICGKHLSLLVNVRFSSEEDLMDMINMIIRNIVLDIEQPLFSALDELE